MIGRTLCAGFTIMRPAVELAGHRNLSAKSDRSELERGTLVDAKACENGQKDHERSDKSPYAQHENARRSEGGLEYEPESTAWADSESQCERAHYNSDDDEDDSNPANVGARLSCCQFQQAEEGFHAGITNVLVRRATGPSP